MISEISRQSLLLPRPNLACFNESGRFRNDTRRDFSISSRHENPHIPVWPRLLGHFSWLMWQDRIHSVLNCCSMCALGLKLHQKHRWFVACSISLTFTTMEHIFFYRQIDNKKKCIHPRIRDKSSFCSPQRPSMRACICILLWVHVFGVSADMPGYRVILHFGFFSCVFPIYLPQTCQTQGDHEKVKLRATMAFRK